MAMTRLSSREGDMKAIFWTITLMGAVLYGLSHTANYVGSLF